MAVKGTEMCDYGEVKSDLSVGADKGGLQEVAGAPRVLGLPYQVSGRVVASTARCSPDLKRSKVTVFFSPAFC